MEIYETETLEERIGERIERILIQPNEFTGTTPCEEAVAHCGYFVSESCPKTCSYALGREAEERAQSVA